MRVPQAAAAKAPTTSRRTRPMPRPRKPHWLARAALAPFLRWRTHPWRRKFFVEQLEERILLDSTQAFPTPLDPLKPFGSLAFAKSHADRVAAAGETDAYTLALDGGQVLTAVLQPTDPSLQVRLELLDPNSATLASADAAQPGAPVVLQTTPITAAGTYQLELVGLAGSGAYTVSLTLGAAVEAEGIAPGAGDDTLAAAQNIDGSSVALPGGADRLAVAGQSDNGSDYYSFHLTQGQTADLALATPAGSGTVHVDLLDASGTLLAKGVAGAINADEMIRQFQVPATGLYYARVSSAAAGQSYSLL